MTQKPRDQIWLFSGLFSSIFPRYRKGILTLEERLDDLLPDNETTTHFRIWNKWEKALEEIEGTMEEGGKLILIGHSNGVYAALSIAKRYKGNVALLASVDRTLRPCPDAGRNIRYLLDLRARLRRVRLGSDFVGTWELETLPRDVGHVEAMSNKRVHDRIVKRVSETLSN
ncbi:MAG: hypothetical protein JJ891_06765 [Rhizobiaceae bacterium]|nr:hypothetical protein [Rhizobiaceae bacterium]